MLANQPQWFQYSLVTWCITVAVFIIYEFLRFLLSRFLNRSLKYLRVDPTNDTFMNNGLGIIIAPTVIVVLYSILEFKQVGLTLFAGAGIIVAILGFASQVPFSNIISGVFIAIFKTFLSFVQVRVGKPNDSNVDLRAIYWTQTFTKGFELKIDSYRITKLSKKSKRLKMRSSSILLNLLS